MKNTIRIGLLIIFLSLSINTAYACATLDGEADGNGNVVISYDYSNCGYEKYSLYVEGSGGTLHSIKPLTPDKGTVHYTLPNDYKYYYITLELWGKKGLSAGDILIEKEVQVRDLSLSKSENYVTDVINRDEVKTYTLNGKEYIVVYSYGEHSWDVEFIVNGETTTKTGYKYIKIGEKRIFSDGSILTFLGITKQTSIYPMQVKFKLESPSETVKKTCTPGWICEGSYKIYISSDCFKLDKEVCQFGCSDGTCLSPTCSTGWMCKNNNEKAYRNSDCSWSSEEYCPYGCANGECIPKQLPSTKSDASDSPGKVCSAGWICKDGATRAYRSSDCTISSETLCSYGCANGGCKGSPSTGAAITDTTGKIECGMFCWIGRLFTSWFTG